jgi:hypothetical protein
MKAIFVMILVLGSLQSIAVECTSYSLLNYWSQHRFADNCDDREVINAFTLRWNIQQAAGPSCKEKASVCAEALKTPDVFDKKCFEALDKIFYGKNEKVPGTNTTMRDYYKKCKAAPSRVCKLGSFQNRIASDGSDIAATKCVAIFTCSEDTYLSEELGNFTQGSAELVCRGYRASCEGLSFEKCPAFGSAAKIRSLNSQGSPGGTDGSSKAK